MYRTKATHIPARVALNNSNIWRAAFAGNARRWKASCKMITLKMGEVPELPDKFRCPICGDKLALEIDAWTSDYDGWKAEDSGVHVTCVTEPDITDDGFDDWLNGHYQMPYVDWLPVDQKVYDWLEDNYRFTKTPSNNACSGQVAGSGKSDGESTPSATCH